jgi:hypothetical protein
MANERRFTMGAGVRLRDDYDAEALRRLARAASDSGQFRGPLVWLLNRTALRRVVEEGPNPAVHSH